MLHRFCKDWADQVTQISSCGNYCQGHMVRARSIRVGLRMRGSLCLLERTCIFASVCLYIYFFVYIRRHTYIHCINKGLGHFVLNECTPMFVLFLIHFPQHTNAYVFSSLCIYMLIFTHIQEYVRVCMCLCALGVSTCVSACACLSECARLSTHVCASLLDALEFCHTYSIFSPLPTFCLNLVTIHAVQLLRLCSRLSTISWIVDLPSNLFFSCET